MLRVFKMSSNLTTDPVTVIAPHAEAAHSMFEIWAEEHCFAQQIEEPKLSLVSADDLAVQPQLENAARQGVSGIAYWCGHRLGYLVAAPQEHQYGAIAPSEPNVRCFAVDDQAEEVLVFARNLDEALSFYRVWNATAYGCEDTERTSASEVTRWLLSGPQVTLREEMDLDQIGVGQLCEDGFWRVFPADYEPTIGR